MAGFAEEQLSARMYGGKSVNLAAFSICPSYLKSTSHVVPMDAALGAHEVHPMHRRATPEVEMNLRAEAFRIPEHDIGRFWHSQSQRATTSKCGKQGDRITKEHPEVVERMADGVMYAASKLTPGCI